MEILEFVNSLIFNSLQEPKPGLQQAWVGIVLGIVSALIGAYSASQASKTAKRNTDMTIQANREQSQYAYNMDLQQWNRENAYNDPSQQMARLKAAGLNPNLVYGNGSVTGNTTTSGPNYNVPEQQHSYAPLDLTNTTDGAINLMNQYQNMRQTQAHTDNIKEQNNIIKLDAEQKQLRNAIYKNELSKSGIDLDIAESTKQYSKDARRLQVEKDAQQIKNLQRQHDIMDKDLNLKEKELALKLQNEILNRYEIKLNEIGVSKSDPLLLRMFIINRVRTKGITKNAKAEDVQKVYQKTLKEVIEQLGMLFNL